MSFRTKFKAALEAGSRSAVIKALAAHPNATIAELRKLSQADSNLAKQFKAITIADLFAPITTTKPRLSVRRYGPDKAPEKSAVNTRTPQERAAYDESLFKAVKAAGRPVGAAEIIAAAGGTPLQARTGLTRLIEAEMITWTGKARGTKYEAL